VIQNASPQSLFTLLLFIAQGNDACRLSETVKKADVDPTDSTHILVSWENVFVDCDDSNVKWVGVQIKTRTGGFDKIQRNIPFSQKNVSLERNPCFQHQGRVVLEMPNTIPTITSNLATYNEMAPYVREQDYFKTFFSGLLNRKVVQKTCLKRDNVSLKISQSPNPIEKCIKLKVKDGKGELGKPLRLLFKVVNPEEKGDIEVHAAVDILEKCPEANVTTEGSESSDETEHVDYA